MLFGEGGRAMSWFATHPPLMERIKSLDPAFNPDELVQIIEAWQQPRQVTPRQAEERNDTSLSGLAPLIIAATVAAGGGGARAAARGPLPAAGATAHVDAGMLAGQVAQPAADDYRAASALSDGVPESLRAVARDAQQAPALVLALAMARDDGDTRRRQLALVRSGAGEAQADAVQALAGQLANLHPLLRLPLASLAFPNLRRLPRPRLHEFVARLQALINADGHVDLAEYCLAKLVQVQVIDALDPAAAFAAGSARLRDRVEEARDLFALVAAYGNEDGDRARQAFQSAAEEAFPGRNLMYAQPVDWQRALDAALGKLDRLRPAGKELVIRGLGKAIADDGVVNVAEAELLRVICAALHCPLPPILQSAPAG